MSDARGDDQTDAAEAWSEVTTGFVDLGTRLRDFFDSAPDEEDNDEMRSAWDDFTDAAQRLGRSVTTAFQDEEVQEGAKRAFGTLVDAVGKTVREAGGQFSWGDSEESDPPESPAAAEDDPGDEES